MDIAPVNRLSSQYINSLPLLCFRGKVMVINTPEGVHALFQDLKREQHVGFDTESRPAFKKGISYSPSIVQLSTHETAYLLQIERIHLPDSLVDFFCNPKIKKIGIGIKNDIEKLQAIRPFHPVNFIDLSTIAAQKGIIQTGARALTARYLEHRLTKNAQRSNWSHHNLTEKQKIYAATDAWICLQIYPQLLSDTLKYDQTEIQISGS